MVRSLIMSASPQFLCLFQSGFSTACDLVLPLSIYIIVSFLYGHAVAAYVFFLLALSLIKFASILSTTLRFSIFSSVVIMTEEISKCDPVVIFR